jgi:hypothetical protein
MWSERFDQPSHNGYPSVQLTDVKMVDLVLWQTRRPDATRDPIPGNQPDACGGRERCARRRQGRCRWPRRPQSFRSDARPKRARLPANQSASTHTRVRSCTFLQRVWRSFLESPSGMGETPRLKAKPSGGPKGRGFSCGSTECAAPCEKRSIPTDRLCASDWTRRRQTAGR